MDFVILGLLLMGEKTLYDLQKAFKEGISLFYSSSSGSIKRSLTKMLDNHWLLFREEVQEGRNKKIYRICESGIEAFYQWMETPVVPNGKLETQALSKLYFLGLLKDISLRKKVLDDIIEAAENMHHQLETQYREILVSFPGIENQEPYSFQIKTLQYGLMSHQAGLKWFQEERARLDGTE